MFNKAKCSILLTFLLVSTLTLSACGKGTSDKDVDVSGSAEETVETTSDETSKTEDKEDDKTSEESSDDKDSTATLSNEGKSYMEDYPSEGEEVTGDEAVKLAHEFFTSLDGEYDNFALMNHPIRFSDEGDYYAIYGDNVDSIKDKDCVRVIHSGDYTCYYFYIEYEKEYYKIVDDGSYVLIFRGNDTESVENENNIRVELHLVDGLETKTVAEFTSRDQQSDLAKSIENGTIPIERKVEVSDDVLAKLQSQDNDYNKVDWYMVTSPMENIVVSEVVYKCENAHYIVLGITNIGDTDQEVFLKGYPKDVTGTDDYVFEISYQNLGPMNTAVYIVENGYRTPTGEIVWMDMKSEATSHWKSTSYSATYDCAEDESGDLVFNFNIKTEHEIDELRDINVLFLDENKQVINVEQVYRNEGGSEFDSKFKPMDDENTRSAADYALFINPYYRG